MPDGNTNNLVGYNKEIYNEGRVVGLSAYELYVREHIAQNPEIPPATEIEWLASSIAFGSSMLLHIGPDNVEKEHYREFLFPQNSRLGAANTIIASWFLGEGKPGSFNPETGTGGVVGSGSFWAEAVTDFGPLISNTSSRHPSGTVGWNSGGLPIHDSNVSGGRLNELTEDQRAELKDYILLADGIVIQPGTWSNNAKAPPAMDLRVNMKEAPRLRFFFADKVEHGMWVLLSGFTLRSVLSGCTGIQSSTMGTNPEDGDFLGPPIHPWSAKVVFTMPAAAAYYLIKTNYFRAIQGGANSDVKDATILEVEHSPVIDMATVNPEDFYKKNQADALVPLEVEKFTTMMEGLAVLTIYQKKSKYPPAIWGTKIDEKGQRTLAPIDVVAQGTIKMFGDEANASTLKEYETTYPGCTGMRKDKNGQIWILNENGEMVPAAEITLEKLKYQYSTGAPSLSNGTGKLVKIRTGDKSALLLSLAPDLNTSQYTMGNNIKDLYSSNRAAENLPGNSADIYNATNNIEWGTLIQCLVDNRAYDVVGSLLKHLRGGLSRNYIQFPNQNSNTMRGDDGANDTGLRLYISDTEPKDNSANPIPIGSIGIGW